MAASPQVHRSTKNSMLKRRATCTSSSERSGSGCASRCIVSLLLPVFLVLLRGGLAASATQVGAGAGVAAAHLYLSSPSNPSVAALTESSPAGRGKRRREACGGRHSRAQRTSFVAKEDDDDGNRLHMPRTGGLRRPDWLVSGCWSVAARMGSKQCTQSLLAGRAFAITRCVEECGAI